MDVLVWANGLPWGGRADEFHRWENEMDEIELVYVRLCGDCGSYFTEDGQDGLIKHVLDEHPQSDLANRIRAGLLGPRSLDEDGEDARQIEGDRLYAEHERAAGRPLVLDTTPCHCCGKYPCDPDVCANFACCPRCY